MNIIHSFYSKNCDDFKLFTSICYFTLSAIYIKNNGGNIKLYTDSKFKEFIHAPYSAILLDLEDLKINPLIWAWPKFIVLEKESLGTIHIDGDVFIKTPKCLDNLTFDGSDCLVQGVEYSPDYGYNGIWSDAWEFCKNLEYPQFAKHQPILKMYNNGVLGINNIKLRDDYIKAYWSMVEQVPIDKEGCAVPDIIFEQQFLTDICETNGYTVKCVLNGNNAKELNACAKDIGYQHVCSEKYNDLDKCIKLIKRYDFKCFCQLKHDWKDRFPEYFVD